jgi:hypothetical protein
MPVGSDEVVHEGNYGGQDRASVLEQLETDLILGGGIVVEWTKPTLSRVEGQNGEG